MMMKIVIARRWKPWKALVALFLAELAFTVPCLALFGIADPDTYRTKLWQDGYDNDFNSSPIQKLYDYANHRTPHVPLVWSSFITQYNEVISIFSVFVLLIKSSLFVLHVFLPIMSVFVHIGLIALYAYSAGGQAGKDTSDPHHPQHGAPWYITKSCHVVSNPSNYHYCQQAKASFAVTLCMLGIYTLYLVLSIRSCFPDRAEKRGNFDDLECPREDKIPHPGPKEEARPVSPGKSAPTPRTVAFRKLTGPATDLSIAKGKAKEMGVDDLAMR